jgi:hypothetical protein
MNNVSKTQNDLQSHLTAKTMASEHSFFLCINEWEQRSISRIQEVANEVRTKLKQSFGRIKEDINISLSQAANEIQLDYERKDHTEIELKRWMDQLENLKQRLQNPPGIELCDDTQVDTNASIIKLIELKIHPTVSKLMRITSCSSSCESLFESICLFAPSCSSHGSSR